MTERHRNFVRHIDVLERWLEDDVVLYHPTTDEVSLLDNIGGHVWAELSMPTSVSSIAAKLADAFCADPSMVANDIDALFETLRAKQLIEPVEMPRTGVT